MDMSAAGTGLIHQTTTTSQSFLPPGCMKQPGLSSSYDELCCLVYDKLAVYDEVPYLESKHRGGTCQAVARAAYFYPHALKEMNDDPFAFQNIITVLAKSAQHAWQRPDYLLRLIALILQMLTPDLILALQPSTVYGSYGSDGLIDMIFPGIFQFYQRRIRVYYDPRQIFKPFWDMIIQSGFDFTTWVNGFLLLDFSECLDSFCDMANTQTFPQLLSVDTARCLCGQTADCLYFINNCPIELHLDLDVATKIFEVISSLDVYCTTTQLKNAKEPHDITLFMGDCVSLMIDFQDCVSTRFTDILSNLDAQQILAKQYLKIQPYDNDNNYDYNSFLIDSDYDGVISHVSKLPPNHYPQVESQNTKFAFPQSVIDSNNDEVHDWAAFWNSVLQFTAKPGFFVQLLTTSTLPEQTFSDYLLNLLSSFDYIGLFNVIIDDASTNINNNNDDDAERFPCILSRSEIQRLVVSKSTKLTLTQLALNLQTLRHRMKHLQDDDDNNNNTNVGQVDQKIIQHKKAQSLPTTPYDELITLSRSHKKLKTFLNAVLDSFEYMPGIVKSRLRVIYDSLCSEILGLQPTQDMQHSHDDNNTISIDFGMCSVLDSLYSLLLYQIEVEPNFDISETMTHLPTILDHLVHRYPQEDINMYAQKIMQLYGSLPEYKPDRDVFDVDELM